MDGAVAHPEYLSYRLKRLYLLISQRTNDALKPYGVACSQWRVLVLVSRAGMLAQRDLQHAMCVESATLTGIVDALAAKGWLERVESAEDKRVRVLLLTPEGRDRLEAIPDPYKIAEARMLQGVSETERAKTQAVLETMICNLEDRS
jgi:DNA-binding MarR family transcriptional regulator